MTKWKNRIKVCAIFILLVYFTIPVVDRIVFAFRVPVDFADATWKGNWNSDQFSIITGRILVKLPDPIPKEQDFDVDALVYYSIWSPYRTASTIRMKMKGHFGSNKSGGGGNSSTPIIVPPHFTFSFKGGAGSSNQSIDYIATCGSADSVIVGGYRSEGPYDMGRFMIEKTY